MATFKDGLGDRWLLRLDDAAYARIKEQTGVDLPAAIKAFDGRPFCDMATDKALLTGMMYAVLEPQIRARSMTPEGFAAAMAAEGGLGFNRALGEIVSKLQVAMGQAVQEAISGHVAKLAESEA